MSAPALRSSATGAVFAPARDIAVAFPQMVYVAIHSLDPGRLEPEWVDLRDRLQITDDQLGKAAACLVQAYQAGVHGTAGAYVARPDFEPEAGLREVGFDDIPLPARIFVLARLGLVAYHGGFMGRRDSSLLGWPANSHQFGFVMADLVTKYMATRGSPDPSPAVLFSAEPGTQKAYDDLQALCREQAEQVGNLRVRAERAEKLAESRQDRDSLQRQCREHAEKTIELQREHDMQFAELQTRLAQVEKLAKCRLSFLYRWKEWFRNWLQS